MDTAERQGISPPESENTSIDWSVFGNTSPEIAQTLGFIHGQALTTLSPLFQTPIASRIRLQLDEFLLLCWIISLSEDEHIIMKDLAQKLGVSNTSITILLDKWEKLGLAKRGHNSKRRNIMHPIVSEEGIRFIKGREAEITRELKGMLAEECTTRVNRGAIPNHDGTDIQWSNTLGTTYEEVAEMLGFYHGQALLALAPQFNTPIIGKKRLPVDELFLLQWIIEISRKKNKPVNMSDVAGKRGLSSAAITGMARKWKEMGLIKSPRLEEDMRNIGVVITQDGIDFIKEREGEIARELMRIIRDECATDKLPI